MSVRQAAQAPRSAAGGRRASLWVTVAWLTLLVGANLPTPLYLVYEQRFGLSSAGVTLIFATYALVLAPSLLLFGQLSDRIGRKPTIVAALGAGMVGLLLFALAGSAGWLFVARAFQGLAVGLISGSATAALVELEPNHDARRAALPAGLAQAAGSAGGAVIGGLLAQLAPAPTMLCYLVVMACTAVWAAAVLAEPGLRRGQSGRWRPQRPNVPASIRARFVRISLTGAAVWSVAALFLAVVPTYTSQLLGSRNLAVLGGVAAVMLTTSCIAQLATRRVASADTAQVAGLLALAAGLALLVIAFPLHSLVAVVLAAVLAGAGHGSAFLAAQGRLNQLAPDERRGEISAAFYVCIYLGVAIPVIGVGALAVPLGLFTAVALFAAVIGSLALVNAAGLAMGIGHTRR